MKEPDAFAALIAARRNHDAGAGTKRDPAPLAIAAAEWIRASGLEAAIESTALTDLDELIRAVQALAGAMVAPETRDRSPAQATALQSRAWEQIGEIAKRRGWK